MHVSEVYMVNGRWVAACESEGCGWMSKEHSSGYDAAEDADEHMIAMVRAEC